MKRILVLALFAVLVPMHAAPQNNGVSLIGILVRSDNGEPIANARVRIGKTDIPPQFNFPFSNIIASFWRPGTEMTAATNEKGGFAFSGLETGDYIVGADADGYADRIEISGKRTRYSDFAKRLTIRISEPPDPVRLSLFRLARIAGVVRGPDGKPVAGIGVYLGSIEYSVGRHLWNSSDSTETNEMGEYQFPARRAGEYYIAVVADPGGGNATATGGQNSPFMATLYPNALDLASAKSIAVDGTDIRADINIPPIPKNWKTISGRVLDGVRVRSTPPNGAPALPDGVSLVSRENGSIENFPLPYRSVELGASDEFVIKDVAPGFYELYTGSYQWPHIYSGHVSVEVKEKDVTGLNIAFDRRSADVITGKIMDDNGAVYPSERPVLHVRNKTPWTDDVQPQDYPRDTSAFRFTRVPVGTYDLEHIGIPSGYYLADIRQSGRSILDSGLVVGGASTDPIEVLIRKGGGTVRIRIQGDSRRPGLVVLVPDPPGRANGSRYHDINSTSSNLTTFENVRPGSYKAFAVESWLYGDYQRNYLNADFLAKYEDLGIPVVVRDGQTSEVRVDMSYR